MDKALTTIESKTYTLEEIQTIKNTVARGTTNDEFKMFLSVASSTGLNPFLKEIWCIKRGPNIPAIIMSSRDGYLKVAQSSPDFDGGPNSFTVCENDLFEIEAGACGEVLIRYKASTQNRGKIIGAWARIPRKDCKPVIQYADFQEYFDDKSPVWKRYPSAMIKKVAEVMALKKQFGISGLITREEMGHDYELPELPKPQPQIVDAEVIDNDGQLFEKTMCPWTPTGEAAQDLDHQADMADVDLSAPEPIENPKAQNLYIDLMADMKEKCHTKVEFKTWAGQKAKAVDTLPPSLKGKFKMEAQKYKAILPEKA